MRAVFAPGEFPPLRVTILALTQVVAGLFGGFLHRLLSRRDLGGVLSGAFHVLHLLLHLTEALRHLLLLLPLRALLTLR